MKNKTQISASRLQDNYLVAQLETEKIAFPTNLVQNILTVELSQILVLPFYDSAFLGVINYQNEIISLVSTKIILGIAQNNILPSRFTAVRLNNSAENLAGIALVVDKMKKKIIKEDLSQERIFKLSDIPTKIWQPQR